MMADRRGIEPRHRVLVPRPGFEPGKTASKAAVFANYTSGALVERLGVEPSGPRQRVYSPPPRPTGLPLRSGGPAEIRTQMDALLRGERLPITPQARNYSPSRYRYRNVGWSGRPESNQRRAGFRPAALPSELRPVAGVKSGSLFMGRSLAAIVGVSR